ncbi:MAG TPA: hypothetical protein VKA10_07145, partial [Prolixibacteraceae bacterium]|nr:hypothetical protein [Prolixibacteraceae bacterium]
MEKFKVFNRLYLQVSAIFLLVLILFAAVTLYVSVQSAANYSTEVNQRLNSELASNMVEVIGETFMDEGKINEAAIADIMHSMMVINPIVEVYLLDPQGKIITYVVPEKGVKLEEVNLGP